MKPSVQCRWLCFKCSVNRNFNLNIVHHTRKQRQITFGKFTKEEMDIIIKLLKQNATPSENAVMDTIIKKGLNN